MHSAHSADNISSGSGSLVLFENSYKIVQSIITIDSEEIVEILMGYNSLFNRLVFEEYNIILKSKNLRVISRMMQKF